MTYAEATAAATAAADAFFALLPVTGPDAERVRQQMDHALRTMPDPTNDQMDRYYGQMGYVL